MNRIKNAFLGQKAFIPFITAGDPTIDKTVEFVFALEKAGAGLIELGIPFSDPMADGPVIQGANARALNGKTTLESAFWAVRKIREKSEIPLVFLTYLNPIHHFGYEAFFEECARSGVDGVIIPDLPYEERFEVADVAKKHAVAVIPLIAMTSRERIKMLAKEAEGFIYVVSSMGVTGVKEEIEADLGSIIGAIREVSQVPTAVGFGINTPEQARAVTQVADGVIVGSAIVKIIEQHGAEATGPLGDYVRGMKNAIC
jgi:tryptophan synthase alpha chain